MLENKLSDEAIREVWVEHFPKRIDIGKSTLLCHMLRVIVEKRAALNIDPGKNTLAKVHQVLAALGIPRDEFYQLEKETDDEGL